MCACVDVIAVRQANDTIKCSPMVVRFYKEANVTQHVGVMIDGEPVQFKCNYRLVLDQGKRYAHFQPYVEDQPRSPVILPTIEKKTSLGKSKIGRVTGSWSKYFSSRKNRSGSLTDSMVHQQVMQSHLLSCQRQAELVDTILVTQSSDKKKKGDTWKENWLHRIDSETYAQDLMTPPYDFLNELNLNGDTHQITFIANGEIIKGRIYVWNHDSKVIISDIDGTITKSDKRGMLMAQLGYDYTHTGVSRLFTHLYNHGYKLIYLTARSIEQHAHTRLYIDSIIQEGVKMPHGPVITTPNKLWNALAREVIIKRPDAFKVTVLESIRSLFAQNSFVAGFGNRPTDCSSYATVGIEPRHCYRINTKGEMVVHHTGEIFQGYTGLFHTCESRFPRIVCKIVDKVKEQLSEEGTDTK